ncbi:hypothetical protein [Cryptosporangium sp. NPDC051539]|uniref:hypothetical protein n=1 Tax=Cryptosporangium sp. NPDC051539 TaxID=3363962 RepID=UPI0037B8AAC5
MLGFGSADDPLFTAADTDGAALPTLRPRFHPDDTDPRHDDGADDDGRTEQASGRGRDRRTARRSLRLKLGAVGLVLVLILAAFGLAGGLLRPDPPPDRPDLRVMTWWWDAFDTFPEPLGSGPWKQSVCDGDTGNAQKAVDAEIRRQTTEWPPAEFVVSVESTDLTYTTTGEDTAEVRFTSITEFYPRGEDGFDFWAAPDQDWTVTTKRDGDQWCVHRIAVTYRAGFDPAEQTPTYGGGGLIGNGGDSSGEAGDDDTIGGGIQGEAHR